MNYIQSENRDEASGKKPCEKRDSVRMRVIISSALHKPGLGPNTYSVLLPSKHTLRHISLTY